jgi:hypothetical protein
MVVERLAITCRSTSSTSTSITRSRVWPRLSGTTRWLKAEAPSTSGRTPLAVAGAADGVSSHQRGSGWKLHSS